jgi:predicted glycosyltransferase
MGRPTLLLYCQHSLGLGHLTRSWALAGHLSRIFRVVFVSGGAPPVGVTPPRGIETIELPALAQHSDGQLFAVDTTAAIDDVRRERKRQLVALYRSLRPDVLVVELFPFGRRKFRDELIALLDETRREPRPVVATSVRDLLVDRAEQQQQHDDRARQIVDAYFDLVLVHSDPRFATLDETFRPTQAMATPVHHTGFVVGSGGVDRAAPGRAGILVSGGGGRFAERLYAMAIDAHRLLGPAAPRMTIVAGPLCCGDTVARLRDAAATNPKIRVERTVTNLSGLMTRAAVSVSQCGYNTALDIVRAGVPAIVVPFEENGDSEQRARATRLEQLNVVRVVRAAAGAGALARAIVAAPAQTFADASLDVSGGARTAAILAAAVEQHDIRRSAAALAST